MPGRHRKADGIPPADRRATEEAQASNAEASKVLHEARARSDEVVTLAAELRRLRTRNHFGDLISAALKGRTADDSG
jgi:hypothetical protein